MENVEKKSTPSYLSDPNYIKTMAMLDEIKRKNEETLSSINRSLNKIGDTRDNIQKTNEACDKFQDEFNKVIGKIGEAIAKTMIPLHKKKANEGETHLIPKVSTAEEVVREMMNKRHIVFLTGAGISAASNIPTFRGAGGYWTVRNSQEKQLKASEFLTHKYFVQDPEEIWRWTTEFKKTQSQNKPNVSHKAIADLQMFCKRQPNLMKCSLITQNIDAYHVEALKKASIKKKETTVPIVSKPAVKTLLNKTVQAGVKKVGIEKKKTVDYTKVTTGKSQLKKKSENAESGKKLVVTELKDVLEESKTSENNQPSDDTKGSESKILEGLCEDIYEIHGNIDLMRCDNECETKIFPIPFGSIKDSSVPKCPNCQGNARPHILFFDELYKEEYYRGASVLEDLKTMDCLVVIGTALETNLAAKIVGGAIATHSLIVEINLQPCIEYGNVRHLIGKAEDFIPALCEGIQKKSCKNV